MFDIDLHLSSDLTTQKNMVQLISQLRKKEKYIPI